ncbi:disease resistance protein RPV1-like [Corylus avellana]|uniref:disease resistance protein RPV1-like n=1 Tax=Corylus avellana TaxID=13451 RepID=UPI00286A8C4E|nr:disease resistance protein RPV1-like [Corylus avellana]
MDDNLKSGDEISLALLKAIEESKISIIVFSKNYASSRWCLEELVKILECRKTKGQNVLPLFYNLNPSIIRNQTNTIGEALTKHKERNEAEFIKSIIEWVNSVLVKKTYFQVAKYPIGIDSRVQDMKRLLDIEKNDITCMAGIFGTGGIGKTTLTKAIYNSIASQFEGCCFLENIRETFSQMDGLMILQNKLLSNILGDSSPVVDNVDRGIILIQDRLRSLRVLLVLDDVDQLDQLEKLVGKDDWFGLGSRIIITTRNKRLLSAHGVYSTYQMNGLNHDEALKLFSWNAFKINDKPNDDFVELINDVVHYAGGLPLALTMIGSALKGGSVEYVTEMLDGRGFHSYSGIEELKDKCLITLSRYGLLEMHDLLQEMGREIVRQESPKEPGQRSRLWFHEDVRHVLEENTGTNEVEGILVNLPNRDPIHLSLKAFKKMKSLKMFINNNACFSGEPNFLSNELRVFDWLTYPGEYFPSNFCGKKLAILRMPFSRLKELKGVQNSQNLTILDFNGCEFLKEIHDVSRIPNLQKLDLACCGNLVKIDHSVGFLDKLVCLNLFCCSNLMDFPRSLKLRSLKSLCLWGCLSLKNFSKIECQMEYLEKINFTYMGAEELPSSIGCLVGLKELYLGGCTNLMDLSDEIYQLQHLECLSLRGCSKVVEFLKKVEDNGQSMPSIVYTKESEISSEDELHQLSSPTNTSDSDDGCSWITFSKLPELEHSNYAPLESNFLKTFACCSTLTILNLSKSDIVALPSCIRKFVGLKKLYMEDCKQLQQIQFLPPNVEEVHAMGCLSLEIFFEEPELVGKRTVFAALQLLSLRNSVQTESYYPISLRVLDLSSSSFLSLRVLDLSSSPIVTLPSCIRKFVGLFRLYLDDCKQLQDIRALPPYVWQDSVVMKFRLQQRLEIELMLDSAVVIVLMMDSAAVIIHYRYIHLISYNA